MYFFQIGFFFWITPKKTHIYSALVEEQKNPTLRITFVRSNFCKYLQKLDCLFYLSFMLFFDGIFSQLDIIFDEQLYNVYIYYLACDDCS